MGSSSVRVLGAIVGLRILALLTLTASLLVMGLNNFKDDDGSRVIFTDLIAYRYVFASGVVGFVYTLIQIPFAIYNVVKEKRLIRNGCLQQFDFFGDKVIALLLASGVGVGFGVSFELKRTFDDSFEKEVKKYLDYGIISTALLLFAVLLMALLLSFSSNRRSSSRGKLFK